jgi:dihydroorotate dehydrogenase electron transfer subunit
MRPVQVRSEVLSRKRLGAYHLLTLVAPGIGESARPGQFVALAVGGANTGMLLRRAFAIHTATPAGAYGGTVQFAVDVHGPGTAWIAELRQGDPVDVVGPLGTPFRLPARPVPAVLVGGGYGSAPLYPLAEALRARDCRVDVLLGAATAERIFAELELKRASTSLRVTTDDGSAGRKGLITDLLPETIEKAKAGVVYACGPMAMLRACAEVAESYGIACQVAVEESMACGIGVCMTCVLPIVGDDQVTRMTRSCVEGPVFSAERVRWADVGTVPVDALGAGMVELPAGAS